MKVQIPFPPEPVSINGLPLEPEDFHHIVMQLDSRRRQHHVKARDAKSLGTQQAEAAKAERLDDLIKLLTYAGRMVDPDEERMEARWKAKAQQKRYQKQRYQKQRTRVAV